MRGVIKLLSEEVLLSLKKGKRPPWRQEMELLSSYLRRRSPEAEAAFWLGALWGKRFRGGVGSLKKELLKSLKVLGG